MMDGSLMQIFGEGMAMDPWMITWIFLAIVTLCVELITVGLTSIWLTGGSLLALLLNVIGAPVAVQIAAFFIATFVLLYFTRPWAIKYVNNRRTRTNYEETIGREVRVIERVDNHASTGRVIYNGMEWTARALHEDDTFDEGDLAIVANVVGVKLIIKRKEGLQDVGLITEETGVPAEGDPVPAARY